jgi:L-malate glycosyltransferase
MKVLHILYSGLGGHGNVFFSMTEANDDNHIQFEALFNGIEDVKDEYVARCRERNIKWSFIKKTPGLDIGYYFKLYRQIKASRPQVIFLHGGAASLPAWFYKTCIARNSRIIVRETQANHLKARIDWIYLAIGMLVADKMVYLSEAYKQQVKAKLKLLYKEKDSVVIPNGINLLTYHRKDYIQNQPPLILGMQSRLISIKDHLTLLDAFALLVNIKDQKPMRLEIAGDGEFKAALVAHAHKKGISDKVIFTGMLEEPELVAFLQRLDIYIHASLGETMSTAIMQAMACGLPIVASDVPGINNMISDHATGLLVPVKDPRAMADAIGQLINNPAKAAELAANAFNFAVQNYSNKKMLESYKAIFTN